MTTAAQVSLEQQLLALLAASGTQTLQQLFAAVPAENWLQLSLAMDHLSREGRISVRRAADGEYRVEV